MDDDAANNQEPYNDIHSLGNLTSIFPLHTIHGEGTQKLSPLKQVKDRANSNRSKETNECRLRVILDLMDLMPHGEHYGHPAQEKDQYPQEDESIDGNDSIVAELCPRADGTEPDENRKVEKHVQRRLERIVDCF